MDPLSDPPNSTIQQIQQLCFEFVWDKNEINLQEQLQPTTLKKEALVLLTLQLFFSSSSFLSEINLDEKSLSFNTQHKIEINTAQVSQT